MDVEKAGTALANGDLAGFMALCDESEVLASPVSTMVIGRMGVLTIEFLTSDNGQRNNLQAHAHADEGEAGACYANTVHVAHEIAVQLNAACQMIHGYDAVTVTNASMSTDYVPGMWVEA